MSIKILALDTSTVACSVALLCDDTYHEHFQIAPRQHNQLVLRYLEQLLAEAGLMLNQLDAIAFGCGPGSFTGLRIAASIVQGLAFAANLPVVPISTLRALAQGARRELGCEKMLVALDACVNEIYWGCYLQQDSLKLQGTEIVCAPAEIVVPEGTDWVGIGDGWDKYHSILQLLLGDKLQKWWPTRYPQARDIAELAKIEYVQGHVVSAEQALPVYLRDNIVKKR